MMPLARFPSVEILAQPQWREIETGIIEIEEELLTPHIELHQLLPVPFATLPTGLPIR
jgi:hypothetical protein